MNLHHLRYAIEVDKTGSISKAAENLYMNQPNLSKALKELETSIGVTLFTRTTKGISATTEDGRVFIAYAKKILAQMEEMERHFHSAGASALRVALPKAGYLTQAMAGFASGLPKKEAFRIRFQQANLQEAIQSVAQEGVHLAVVRYLTAHERYFRALFRERGLERREILSGEALVVLSAQSALSQKALLELSDLEALTELTSDEFWVPCHLSAHEPGAAFPSDRQRQLFVSDEESRLALLAQMPDAYLWTCPMPKEALACRGLLQKPCNAKDIGFKDVLISRRGYAFTELDQRFVDELEKAKERMALV